MWTEILFEVSFEELAKVTEDLKKKLIKYCDDIMPKEVGFDVLSVDFKPRLDLEYKRDIVENLNKTFSFTSVGELSKILNSDLIQKGASMSEVYLYLYCIENSIRVFIDKKLFETYGINYFDKLDEILKRKIAQRKKNEEKNKWLSFRGSSYLFYLDFKDLSSIIIKEWEVFQKYFPTQNWIATKIEDLSEVRNLIAHNSYVSEKEIKLMKSYFEIILHQIEKNSN